MIDSFAGPVPHFQTTSPPTPQLGPGPENGAPVAQTMTFNQFLHELNPLHHLPGVGMIYRAVTGESISPAMRVIGGAVTGGPLGALGAVVMSLAETLFSMPADTSRAAAPAGMAATGSEQGMQPVSPGELPPGGYTTLATNAPAWLPSTQYAGGPGTQMLAAQEYQRAQWIERGVA